jgi:RecB family exonuclease
MAGSYRASQIDKAYRREKFYKDRKKKDDERLEKMVEDFVEDMKNEVQNK